MNVQPTREGGQWSESRRLVLAFLLLASVVGGVVAARGANATVVVGESAIVSAVRLLAHGIELKAVPFTEKAPAISAESAQATARKVIDAAKDPDETFRVLASATYDAPKRRRGCCSLQAGRKKCPVARLRGRSPERLLSILPECWLTTRQERFSGGSEAVRSSRVDASPRPDPVPIHWSAHA